MILLRRQATNKTMAEKVRRALVLPQEALLHAMLAQIPNTRHAITAHQILIHVKRQVLAVSCEEVSLWRCMNGTDAVASYCSPRLQLTVSNTREYLGYDCTVRYTCANLAGVPFTPPSPLSCCSFAYCSRHGNR